MVKECHVGVKGIIQVGNSCLVVQKGIGAGSYWDIPGGRIDDSETLDETLVRELKEELPTIGPYHIEGIVHAYRLSRNISDDRGLVLIFYKVIAESFDVFLSNEHDDYRWVTKESLHELLISDHQIESGYYEALRVVLGA
jgi:8-oxo-dGTP pyrophosphatase MutT (NUDIX family)